MFINKNIAISETGFVFNPVLGDSFSVNQVGNFILRMLQKGTNKEEIIQGLTEKFGVDAPTVEKDLADFFLMLQYYQILQEND